MGWLAGWSYRKAITVSNGSADYQTKVLVGESSGAVGEEVDCGGHVAADFDDLRFTAADETTLLDYWIESITGTTPNCLATVWVQNNSTPDTTLYMYYGGTETAVSNGDNTFLFFDDFLGSAIDTNKWSLFTGVWPVVGGGILDTNNVSSVVVQNTANYALFNTSVAVRHRGGITGQNPIDASSYLGFSNSAISQFLLYPHGAYGMLTYNGTVTSTQDTATTAYKIFDILWISSSSVKYIKNGGTATTHTTNIPTVNMGAVIGAGNVGYKALCDWFLIRKYTATEPSFAFGSEKTAFQPWAIIM